MNRPTSTATGRPSGAATSPMPSPVAYDMAAARRLVASRARGWLTRWSAVALALLVVVPSGVAVTVDRWGSLGTSTWEFAGGPLGWTVFALAVVVGSVSLPLFVAYGISRRAVLQTYAVLGAGLALAGGVVMAAGYAVERALYERLDASQALSSQHLYAEPSQWAAVVAEHGLRGATMLLTGWVVGLLFYRWVWWAALAGTAAAFAPYGLGAWAVAVAPAWAAALTMVLGVGVLVGVAHLVAHDLPVRARRG